MPPETTYEVICMKYILVIGDGMADNPVPQLGGKTPMQAAETPVMDSLAAAGIVGSVVNCPKPLPAGSETAILSIFGCDPLQYFTGRAPQEAAALGIKLKDGDVCYRCNLVAMEDGDMPYEEKKILSHSAGSISAEDALAVIDILNSNEEFRAVLDAADMELYPVPTFRPLAVCHKGGRCGFNLIPPHDHLGEKCGPLLPCAQVQEDHGTGKGSEVQNGETSVCSGDAKTETLRKRAGTYTDIQRTANRVLENHPFNIARKASGKLPANGVWLWAEGTAVSLPDFKAQYGCSGAVVSAVPIVHGIGVLRGLEMVEVEGATGEIDTNFEGKMEATWAKLQEYDFVCLHLEAPDECTHNGDLPGKVQAITWLDSRLVAPIVERLRAAGEDFRMLIVSDHKTLTATRGHDGDPAPFLIYDSRKDSGTSRKVSFDEETCEKGEFIDSGCTLLDMLFELK